MIPMLLLALVFVLSALTAVYRPIIATMLVLVTYPFLVGMGFGIGIHETVFIGLLIGWCTGWLGRIFLCGNPKIRTRLPVAVFYSSLAVGGAIIFALVNGLAGGASFLASTRDLSVFVGYFVLLPAANTLHHERVATKALWVVAVVGIIMYAWNTWFWITLKHGGVWQGWPTFEAGAIMFGPFIASMFPLAVLSTSARTRMLALIGVGGLTTLAMWSGYRHRLLAAAAFTVIGLAIVWAVNSRSRAYVVLVGTVVVSFVATMFAVGLQGTAVGDRWVVHYSALWDRSRFEDDPSFQWRVVEVEDALRIFWQRPLTGVGLGLSIEDVIGQGSNALLHHIWVSEMLMKFGVLGSLAFLWHLAATVQYAVRLARAARNVTVMSLAAGLAVWVFVSLIPAVGSYSALGFSFTLSFMLVILQCLCLPGSELPHHSGIVARVGRSG